MRRAVTAWQGRQQRHQREDRNDRDVLKEQHGEGSLAARVFMQALVRRAIASTIAVEDIARISPTASAGLPGQAEPGATAPITSAVPTTCKPPRPRIGRRICHSSAGRNSSPMRKSIITTPNSAKCITSAVPPATFSAYGPMTAPARRYPITEPSPSRFASGTVTIAASRVDECLEKSAAHCLHICAANRVFVEQDFVFLFPPERHKHQRSTVIPRSERFSGSRLSLDWLGEPGRSRQASNAAIARIAAVVPSKTGLWADT